MRRNISPAFWARVVIPLNSIWVHAGVPAPTKPGEDDRRGALERFLCKAEEKIRAGTWIEAAEGMQYLEIVDSPELREFTISDDLFQRQMLRLIQVIDTLRGLSVFKSEPPRRSSPAYTDNPAGGTPNCR